MTHPTVEDRLRSTLQEVANRVPDDVDDDQLPPLAFASHARPTRVRRLVVAGVAALVLAVLGLGVAELGRTDESEDVATEGGPVTRPERPPTGTLGDTSLDYAYTSQGAIWAVGTDGRVVRLTDGTPRDANGWPFASPAGDLVFFSENDWEGIFWRPMSVAVGDGGISERRQFASTWSPNASLAAGMVPLDDTGAPTEISIVDVENDAELFRISLGLNYETGDVQTLAWDGSERLLVLTRPTNDVEFRKELWAVDLATRTASALILDGGTVGRALIVAEQTRSPGRYPAVRVLDGHAEWGDVVLGEGTAGFERRSTLPAGADGHSIDLGGRLYLDARRGVDSHYLLGDGRSLFELTPEGELRFLRGDVERASAP